MSTESLSFSSCAAFASSLSSSTSNPLHCSSSSISSSSSSSSSPSSSASSRSFASRDTARSSSRAASAVSSSTATSSSCPPVLCIVFDLESTGLAVNEEEVIQLGAEVLVYANGVFLRPASSPSKDKADSLSSMFSSLSLAPSPHHQFTRFVHTTRTLTPRIQQLTNITPAILSSNGAAFEGVMTEWLAWIAAHRAIWGSTEVALVGHNVAKFDIPLLYYQSTRNKLDFNTLLSEVGVTHVFDSLLLAKHWRKLSPVSVTTTPKKSSPKPKLFSDLAIAKEEKSPSSPAWPIPIDFTPYKTIGSESPQGAKKPPSNGLGALYKECFNRDLNKAHDAMGDVTGVADLLIDSVIFSQVQEQSSEFGSNHSLNFMQAEFCIPLRACLTQFQSTKTPTPKSK